MSATAAIARLLKDSNEWRGFYRSCCEASALRLRSQARQFRDELRERGRGDLTLASVEDALLQVARKALPKTPAAEWDEEWAAELCDDALARISEHYAGLSASEREAAMEFSGRREWEERMVAAGVANDPAAFRDALRGWERTTLAALETATQGAA
jgi:hypothetical protein